MNKLKDVDFLNQLKIKIFADGADLESILTLKNNSLIKGFTTNPSLMKKSGIEDYCGFAKLILKNLPDHPISFEVFADHVDAIIKQAAVISSWGSNVYVKVPVTNTKGKFLGAAIKTLSGKNIKLNVTAVFTIEQVEQVLDNLNPYVPAIISVFAGYIADTGIDPVPVMQQCLDLIKKTHPRVELLWAGTHEIINIMQANYIGCDIITVSYDLLDKLYLIGKSHTEFSLDTVRAFYEDACKVGYTIPV